MILTADVFADICRTLWGHDWKVRAAKRLQRTERQLLNIEKGKSNISMRIKRELLAIVREQIKILEGYEREISAHPEIDIEGAN